MVPMSYGDLLEFVNLFVFSLLTINNNETKNVDSFGNIKYAQVDGLECFAKTDEYKANVF